MWDSTEAGTADSMARNSTFIRAPKKDVFAHLADATSYSDWVVGTSSIIRHDPDWPKPGSELRYRARGGISGTTRVVDRTGSRQMVLTSQLFLADIRIVIDLEDAPGGTTVYLEESIARGALRVMFEPGLHTRNASALARLKALVEGGGGGPHSVLHALNPRVYRLGDRVCRNVLDSADIAFLGVEGRDGPHVTPVAFRVSSGRIWLVTSRNSIKARKAGAGSPVGILVRSGQRSVVMQGSGAVLDPLRMWRLEHLLERAYAGPALLEYLTANRTRVGDYLDGGLSALADLDPTKRVLIAVSPERLVALSGEHIVSDYGFGEALGRPRRTPADDETTFELPDVPPEVETLAEQETPAALAWVTDHGPLVLPARWDPERGVIHAPARLLEGLDEAPAALCLEGSGDGLDEQRGVLIRGHGRVAAVEGGLAEVVIDAAKTTAWQGASTVTR